MSEFAGKVAIVTGGGRGIGLALIAQRGGAVALASISTDRASADLELAKGFI
jgi:NAD(P)-dependent dehydrogenase (short-subunit alcohol dehydrogenase family)